MRKIRLIFIIVLVSSAPRAESQQRPTIYPGAVPSISGRELKLEDWQRGSYLTRDSYQKVKAYYVNENGEPGSERDGERGKGAFFSYVRRMPDDVGVSVNERQGRSRVPNSIFSNLRGLAVQGIISDDRVNQIREKYSYLENCYYITREDESGKLVSVDDIIFREYEKKVDPGVTAEADADDMMERAQQLIAQGKMQEGLELMKKYQERQIAGIELATSPRAAEIWIECLEELAANAYDVQISIQL